jgi:hypothetical protein
MAGRGLSWGGGESAREGPREERVVCVWIPAAAEAGGVPRAWGGGGGVNGGGSGSVSAGVFGFLLVFLDRAPLRLGGTERAPVVMWASCLPAADRRVDGRVLNGREARLFGVLRAPGTLDGFGGGATGRRGEKAPWNGSCGPVSFQVWQWDVTDGSRRGEPVMSGRRRT